MSTGTQKKCKRFSSISTVIPLGKNALEAVSEELFKFRMIGLKDFENFWSVELAGNLGRTWQQWKLRILEQRWRETHQEVKPAGKPWQSLATSGFSSKDVQNQADL
jgi:hypothetical protein